MTDPTLAKLVQSLPAEKRAQLAALLAPKDAVAIVGMACRFPRGADDPESYARLFFEGRDAVTEVPADRWDAAAFYDPDPAAPGKAKSKWGGFIEGVDRFDPEPFGISPREAVRMDPQQRVLLEVSWQALEDAGRAPAAMAGTKAGVFIGIYQSDYAFKQLEDLAHLDAYTTSGMSHAIAANRVSFAFDLRGPSLAIDTACSSSLVTIHMACQSLLSGESDWALAGGVNLMLSPLPNIPIGKWGMFAGDGRCKTFDARADGFVRGEGCGVVTLRRLSDALRDGDSIRAIIRGSAVNQDGRTHVLTAPNGPAQEAVIREALQRAGVEGSAIGYVETHGTGTALGDPIEVEALAHVLGRGDRPCRLGAVKTNIGHLEAAAGAAALIKAVLVLEAGRIPPNLHFERLNPHIRLDGTRLTLPREIEPWDEPDHPRLAGVSGFGFGGTNAHLVLEEAPRSERALEPAADRGRLLLLSASSEEALARSARALAPALAAPVIRLDDASHTLAVSRAALAQRAALIAESSADAASKLSRIARGDPGPEVMLGRRDPKAARSLVFVFPGQGTQWPEMGLALAEEEPLFREALARVDAEISSVAGWSVLDVIRTPATSSRLAETERAQPAIFAIGVALTELLAAFGVHPSAVIGHSIGEVTAAWASGAISLADAARIVVARGRAMQGPTGRGRMLAVRLSAAELGAQLLAFEKAQGPAALGQLGIAAINAPSQSVVAGDAALIEAFAGVLAKRSVQSKALPVDYAFHSPKMETAAAEVAAALGGIEPHPGRIPLYSTVSGARSSPGDFGAAYWKRNVRQEVRFMAAVTAAIADHQKIFLEVGPASALRPAIIECAEGEGAEGISAGSVLEPDHARRRDLLKALGRLYVAGIDLEPAAVAPGRLTRLPTSRFAERRFWLAAAPAIGATDIGPHPLLGSPVRSSHLDGAVLALRLDRVHAPFLVDHTIFGTTLVPVAAYLEALAAAGAACGLGPSVAIEDVVVRDVLVVGEDGRPGAELWVAEGGRAFGVAAPNEGGYTTYAEGRLTSAVDGAPQGTDLAALRAGFSAPIDGDSYYRRGAAQGGALGPRFLGIHRVSRRENEALTEIIVPEILRAELSGYRFHPALLDCALHSVYAALPDAEAEKAILLPVRIDRARFFRPAEERMWCWFRRRTGGADRLVGGDVRVLSESGQTIADIEGVFYLPATREQLQRHDAGASLYAIEQVPVEAAVSAAQTQARWVLFGREEATALVARALRSLDLDAVVSTAEPSEALATVAALPKDARVVWCAGGDGAAPLEAQLRSQLTDLVSLVRALVAADRPERLRILTTHAALVRSSDRLDLVQAALYGAIRALRLEHRQLLAGVLDVDLESAKSTERLSAALEDLEGGVERVLREGQLTRPVWVRAPSSPPQPFSARHDRTYLVTGALGGVGRSVVEWLIERGARSLLLVGRSNPSADQSRFLQAQRDRGARVEYARADAAVAGEIEKLLTLVPQGAPLAGVFHLAGVVEDAPLAELSDPLVARNLAPKVEGSQNLDRLTRGCALEVFCVLSSAAGALGSPGQAAYASANAFMSALCEERRRQGLVATALELGPWADGGMAARLGEVGQRRFAAWGMTPLSAKDGLALLEAALGRDRARWMALAIEWSKVAEAFAQAGGPPPEMLDRLLARRPPAAKVARGTLLEKIRSAPVRDRRRVLYLALAERVRSVLQMPPDGAIDAGRGFFEIGMDSLSAIELREGLLVALDLPPKALPATAVFDHPSLDALSAHLLAATGLAEAAPQAAPEEAPAEDLERLSEDELVALLKAEIKDGEGER
ncbi:MAG: SDR family NAD(P)-dependent oxidoreductase [Deltaproteobacteria bacterium]|nr:SDR family NAD(P)-dependent oxidoreductase [Deltaproteobacteria bacterium]